MGGPPFFPGQIIPGMPRIRRYVLEPNRGASGSGVVLSASKGLILTTEQAIFGAPRAAVLFTDGREVEADRLIRDPQSELVVLTIDPKMVGLKEAEWGTSAGLQLGDWVLAVGRPSGRSHAVSAGIVSGHGAGLAPGIDEDAIRTDAVVDGTNAGGPLVDLEGKVVGINRAVRDAGGRLAGFSAAIPAERARRLAVELADFGEVRRGYLGLVVASDGTESSDLFAAPTGLVVTGVTPGGPASDAGIRVGDRIVTMDGQSISGLEPLSRAVETGPVGQEFRLGIDRSGKRQEIVVKSRPRPASSTMPMAPVAPAPRAPAPRGRAGDRSSAASRVTPSPGGPVIRSESPEDPAVAKPKSAPSPKSSETKPAQESEPKLEP
jgi:serine protease Do